MMTTFTDRGHYSQPAAGRTLDGTAVAGGVCRRAAGDAAAPCCCASPAAHLVRRASSAAILSCFRETPLLMQLFPPSSAWRCSASTFRRGPPLSLALTFYTSAFLLDIWFGSIRALPKGRVGSVALSGADLRPDPVSRRRVPAAHRHHARRLALPFRVIKGFALASIIGFIELTGAGTMLTNVTYQPFKVFALVALGLLYSVLSAVALQPLSGDEIQCLSSPLIRCRSATR